jgi:hypothetical protein
LPANRGQDSVTLTNKRAVGINAVPLKDFEQGGTAATVRHDYGSPFTGWHPPADESWKIVERAEFLLRLQPRLPYNLVGHNCEVIANMCVSGGWTESYQARRYFAVRIVMDNSAGGLDGCALTRGTADAEVGIPVVVAGKAVLERNPRRLGGPRAAACRGPAQRSRRLAALMGFRALAGPYGGSRRQGGGRVGRLLGLPVSGAACGDGRRGWQDARFVS